MYKCRSICENFSLKHIRVGGGLLIVSVLGLESFLFVTSCIVLRAFPSNTLFIPILTLSILSFLVTISTSIILLLLSFDFKRLFKSAIIIQLVSYLALSAGHIYYAVLISSIKNYLISQIPLCQNSDIFAGIYWEYKKLYYNCGGSLENCQCFTEFSCTPKIILELYQVFQCDGMCGIGTNSCLANISHAILKVGGIYTICLGFTSGFLILCAGLSVGIMCIKKSKIKWSPEGQQNVSEFDGISAEIIVSRVIPADSSYLQSPSAIEIQRIPEDLSSMHLSLESF